MCEFIFCVVASTWLRSCWKLTTTTGLIARFSSPSPIRRTLPVGMGVDLADCTMVKPQACLLISESPREERSKGWLIFRNIVLAYWILVCTMMFMWLMLIDNWIAWFSSTGFYYGLSQGSCKSGTGGCVHICLYHVSYTPSRVMPPKIYEVYDQNRSFYLKWIT